MTLCQLFHVFRDRASVPTGIKEFHLQIASKIQKKQVKSLLGKTPSYFRYCLLLLTTCMHQSHTSSSSLHSLSSSSSFFSGDTLSTLYRGFRPAKVFTNQDMPIQLKMMSRSSRDILGKKVEMERGQVVWRVVRVSRTRKLTRWFWRRRFK